MVNEHIQYILSQSAIKWGIIIIIVIIIALLARYFCKELFSEILPIHILITILFVALLAEATLSYAYWQRYDNEMIYQKAEEYVKEEKYIEAFDTFSSIAFFGDVQERIEEIRVPYSYEKAREYEVKQQWKSAAILYCDLDYKDSKERFTFCAFNYLRDEGIITDGDYNKYIQNQHMERLYDNN